MKNIQGTVVLETLEEIADPKHTALLVIDVQNDNSSPKGSVAKRGIDISWIIETLARIKKVLEEARRLGLMIIFTRTVKFKDGSHASGPRLHLLQRSAHVRGATDYDIEGTWGNEVLDELAPRPNERQVFKLRSSAFFGTHLDMIMRYRGIKTAVFMGLVTEGCVETTVRDAEQYGYYSVILKDCVCSPRKDFHEAAILIMSSRYDVVTSEELLKMWHSASTN